MKKKYLSPSPRKCNSTEEINNYYPPFDKIRKKFQVVKKVASKEGLAIVIVGSATCERSVK